ncbi:ABC transporter substrate-binding protein [Psychrobacter lutiphocae]|uniref:ABC transporter substrate-binding protein n=1 Tax=Psychrobacter lutiphocae TaxID=540500 RepID=UPI000377DBB5|nr:extracellular solute-binding protein [Psychrobacter lutiphocae]
MSKPDKLKSPISRRRFLSTAAIAGLAGITGIGLTGCQPKSDASSDLDSSANSISNTNSNVVKVYNWTEYIADSVLKAFTAETGIEVVYSTFDSNEAMYAKLKLMNNSGDYDVIFPSTDFVDKMRREGMLETIDHNKLSNFNHLNTAFLDADFDPGNQISIPYLWGSSGIAVNTNRLNINDIKSWEDLWRPEFEGRVMLMNDMRDVFMFALLTLGLPTTTEDPEHIRQAYQKLSTLMPNVRTFNSDAPRMPFMEGETYLGMCWNGEVIMAQDQGMPELDFVYPEEGVIMWMDNMCIPKNAKNIDNAHRFIDFILRPENSAIISEEIGYGSPSEAAKKLLPAEIANNPTVYPPDELLAHALFRSDVSDRTMALLLQYWDRLKVDM